MVSVDEAYLDLAGTERLHGPPFAAADKLLRTITRQTGLPCSGGLATTRLTAKVASDQGKPRGLVWVAPGMEARFLAPLPIRKIPGIGEVTERALRALGIETVEQLASHSQEKLEKIFGQWGTALYRKARGGDAYEFLIDAEPKSISHNHTFGEDTSDVAEMETMPQPLIPESLQTSPRSGPLRAHPNAHHPLRRLRNLHPFQNAYRARATRHRYLRRLPQSLPAPP